MFSKSASVFLLLPVCLCLNQLLISRPIAPRNQQKPLLDHAECSSAILKGQPNAKISLDDCFFLNDVLHVQFWYLTNKPICIRYIRLTFETQLGTKENGTTGDRETSVEMTNPMTNSERCMSSMNLTVTVLFRSNENAFCHSLNGK